MKHDLTTNLCLHRQHGEQPGCGPCHLPEPRVRRDARSADESRLSQAKLRVCGLSVTAEMQSGGEAYVLKDVSFGVGSGEVVGVLGESGAGKTTLGLALLHVLRHGLHQTSGEIWLNDRSMETLDEEQLRRTRGAEISLLYQDSSALNPCLRVGHQVAEVITAHKNWHRSRCRERAAEALAQVGLGEGERLFRSYPHQLSGGQKQRVCVALALACEPSLVVADEPTASLDPSTAANILDLMLKFKQERGTSFLLISHDPNVLRKASDRLLVMYGGEIVESGRTDDVLATPLHPYTQALLRCAELFSAEGQVGRRWPSIAGYPPDPTKTMPGCSFAPRCAARTDRCSSWRSSLIAIDERQVRCLEYEGEP